MESRQSWSNDSTANPGITVTSMDYSPTKVILTKLRARICSTPCTKAFYQVDIFLPNNNICIEIKGGAHDSETQQRKDLRKEEYLKIHFGVETISARAEWFLDSKHKPRHEWIAMYSKGIAKLLS